MYDGLDSTKIMFGENAIHVPLNIVIQGAGESGDRQIVSVIGQSAAQAKVHPILFGGTMTHQLILGDCIIRPRLVIETNDFIGRGLNGLALTAIGEWARSNHKVLLDPMGEASRMQ